MEDFGKKVAIIIGVLIGGYLLGKYGGGFASVVSSTGNVVVNETKTLQGR